MVLECRRVIDRWATVFFNARGEWIEITDQIYFVNICFSVLLAVKLNLMRDDRISIMYPRQPDIIIENIKYYWRLGAATYFGPDCPRRTTHPIQHKRNKQFAIFDN